MIGEPDAGNSHVRFDAGVQETCGSVTRLCPTLPESPISMLFLSSLSVRSSKSSSLQVDRRRPPRSTNPYTASSARSRSLPACAIGPGKTNPTGSTRLIAFLSTPRRKIAATARPAPASEPPAPLQTVPNLPTVASLRQFAEIDASENLRFRVGKSPCHRFRRSNDRSCRSACRSHGRDGQQRYQFLDHRHSTGNRTLLLSTAP